MKTFTEFMQEKSEGVLLGPTSRRVTDPAPPAPPAPRKTKPKTPGRNLAVPKNYEPKPGSRIRRAK